MAPAGRSRWFLTDEPQHFGSGWLSGTLGAVLGLAALSCLRGDHARSARAVAPDASA